MLKEFTPRLYQETIFNTATKKNTLVVLPTGMGKTAIFLMLAEHRLRLFPESKILLLGPTRPLINQYFEVFKKHFDISEEQMAIFTGFVSPEKRKELWKNAKIIFSTPQGLENDIISRRINLEEVSLLGIDEAHRAVRNYSYVWVAKRYMDLAKHPRILGLTASPGSEAEKIDEVCKSLFIDEIELRTSQDEDVVPYTQEVDFVYNKVELPDDFKIIKKYLEQCYSSKLNEVKRLGYMHGNINNYNKKTLIAMQAGIHAQIAQGERDFNILKSISLIAEALKVNHASELLETQGIYSLKKYFDKLLEESTKTKVKAVKNLVNDFNFKQAYEKTTNLYEKGIDHPKLLELKRIVLEEIKNNNEAKIMVFVQYRDTGTKIVEELHKLGVSGKLFVGQMKKKETGLSQKNQKQMIDDFSGKKFNVLVSSSVGEEGLDIPQVDLVVFYEPIPSAIRKIQRTGRTGRLEKGKVIMLITKNTRDEAYHYVSQNKVKRMYTIIDRMKNKFKYKGYERQEPKLSDFENKEKQEQKQELTIYVDYREKGSGIIKELIELGVKIELTKLEVADYLLSSRVAVEHKTTQDFVDSIVDGRLLHQLKDLRKYERAIMIIEGIEDIYSLRKIHPSAIQGILATISVDYNIPIIQTKTSRETAQLLNVIAKREQEQGKKDFVMHTSKPLTLKEQQEYLISALPGIGTILNKPLLKKFKSVKNIINASEYELREIDLIGEKKAKAIKDIVDKDYEE